MAFKLIEGFDLVASNADVISKGWSFAEGTLSQTTGRFGGGGYTLGAATGTVLNVNIEPVAANPYVSISFWVNFTAFLTSGSLLALRDVAANGSAASAASSHFYMEHKGGGDIEVLFHGVSAGIASSVFTAATWHHVEVRTFVDDSSGTFSFLVDGIEVFAFSGDTKDSATAGVSLHFGGGASGSTVRDDIVFQQDTTTLPAVLGEHKIHTLLPVADTAQTDWVRSSGSNDFEMIDDPIGANDGDTTYISATTLNNKSEFGVAGLTESPTTIHLVQLVTEARKTDAGTKGVTPFVQSGATEGAGVEFGPSETYSYATDIFVNDPNIASAWTETTVNAVLVGVEITT